MNRPLISIILALLFSSRIAYSVPEPQTKTQTQTQTKGGKTYELKLPDNNCIGGIVNEAGEIKGTAFVAVLKKQVITSSHVISKLKTSYYLANFQAKENKVHLSLIKDLPESDLAILESEKDLCKFPFRLADSSKLKIGDQIFHLPYFGAGVKEAVAVAGIIQSVGVITTKIGDSLIKDAKFIEYAATGGMPGHSGSPVFNFEGKVLAVVGAGWVELPMKPSPGFRMVRAYSIKAIVPDAD